MLQLQLLHSQSIVEIANRLEDSERRLQTLHKPIGARSKQDNVANVLLTLAALAHTTSTEVTTAGNVAVFKNGREFAASLGLIFTA